MSAIGRKRVLGVQHAAFAGPGRRGQALRARCDVDVVDVSLGAVLPATLAGYDALVVLGGPQSAFSDEGYPTREREAALVRDAVAGRTPYLGICLGAQVLASVAGGTCYRGAAPEIGWTPVRTTDAADHDPVFGAASRTMAALGRPGRVHVMQSHWDHYTLPGSATVLMTGDEYPNQAFRVADAWGLQFHPEAAESFASTRRLLVPGWAEAEESTGDDRTFLDASGAVFGAMFEAFVDRVAA